MTSSPAAVQCVTTSWPSCPPAPVTRTRISAVRASERRSGLERLPPAAVVAVPTHRRLEGLVEVVFGPPAERLDLVGADRVAAVVAEAVGDGLDRRLVLAEDGEDAVGQVPVRDLVAGADVVDLADLAPAQHHVDGAAVVLHVAPVADVAT